LLRILTVADFEVMLMETGEQALTWLESTPHLPQIITCDISLSGLDGFGVLRKIKSNPKIAHIPVIMLTALGQLSEASRAKRLGASDYISKPFSPHVLIGILRKHVTK
jgi:putative two-component system response regulator